MSMTALAVILTVVFAPPLAIGIFVGWLEYRDGKVTRTVRRRR